MVIDNKHKGNEKYMDYQLMYYDINKDRLGPPCSCEVHSGGVGCQMESSTVKEVVEWCEKYGKDIPSCPRPVVSSPASALLQLLQKRRHGLRASIAAASQSSPNASAYAATKATASGTVHYAHQSRTSRITASMGAAILVVGDGRLLGRRYSRLQQVTGGR